MSGSISLPPVPLYESIIKDESTQVAKFASWDPQTKAGVAYFQQVAPGITTPTQLLKNYRALQVVLSAFNMSSVINEPAVLKDLMTQNPSDPKSLVKQMGNPDWTRFATYMSNWNPPPFQSPSTVQTIVSSFQTNQFESNQDQQSPGIQAALQFTKTVTSATTLTQLMADPNLLKVVEGAVGEPQQFGMLGYDEQVRILKHDVDMSQFKTAAGVKKFVEQYLAMNQINPPPAPPNYSTTSLFGAGSSGVSIVDAFV